MEEERQRATEKKELNDKIAKLMAALGGIKEEHAKKLKLANDKVYDDGYKDVGVY